MTSDPASDSPLLPPSNLAAELVRQLERRSLLDPGDENPYKVSIVATRAQGDDFVVIYRQARSPELCGIRGNAADYSAGFSPEQTPDQLASIILQGISEPNPPGRPGPQHWGAGLVPDPEAIGWL